MLTSRRAWPQHVDLRCLHGDQSDWTERTVIVPAVYREWRGGPPPSWLSAQYPVFLYQRLNASRACACANRGFESGVYFQFIAQHYGLLPAHIAFVQADWIFATKTSLGRQFTFWQPRCVKAATAARSGTGSGAHDGTRQPPWVDYMPLGGRRTAWPPRCVIRKTTFYGRFVGRRNAWLAEACARELLHVLRAPVAVRPFERRRPLNVTFYTNMNFLVSRRRLRRYSHAAWRALARRFVHDGVCLPNATGAASSAASSSSSSPSSSGGAAADPLDDPLGSVVDARAYGKWTLGMTTELLQQSIFGFAPLEDGPPPLVPLDARHCESLAPTKCTINT